jgi:hypothetical protein
MKILDYIIFTIVITTLSGCAVGDSTAAEPIEPWVESSCGEDAHQHYAALLPGFTRDFEIAVGPTTRNMSASQLDLDDAVSKAKALGKYLHVILLCSFGDPTANLYDYRRLVDVAARASMGLSLALDIRSLPHGAGFADANIRQAYLDEVEQLVNEHPPEFLNLCVEMNAYALDDATKADYPNLVTLYEEAYNRVKFLSPDTVTYFSHSWELDLLHITDGPLNMFKDLRNHIDAAGISTFPQIVGIKQPAEIPGIYYYDLPQYVDVPIIVECGFSDSANYDSSPEIARDFPPHLMRALGDLNLALIQLVEMHDLPSEGLDPFFRYMGLRSIDGAAKSIYCGWLYIADAGT